MKTVTSPKEARSKLKAAYNRTVGEKALAEMKTTVLQQLKTPKIADTHEQRALHLAYAERVRRIAAKKSAIDRGEIRGRLSEHEMEILQAAAEDQANSVSASSAGFKSDQELGDALMLEYGDD